jgi:8-oxo-dGTP pyrophosphatase MutT (NUDIX family)
MTGEPRRRRRRPARPQAADPTHAVAGASAASLPSPQAKGAGKKKNRSRKKGGKKPARRPTKTEAARQASSTRKEVSAGGVLYRHSENGGIEVLLASRRTLRGNIAWGLAKGHIEPDETPEDAAIREVKEETGFAATIEENLGLTKYFYVWEDVRIRKTVHFFLMRVTGGNPNDRDDEMEEVRWFPLDRAAKRAAYRGEREILGRAAGLLR